MSERIFDAASAVVPHEPAEQVVSGNPTTGVIELGDFKGVEIGIWEITPGVVTRHWKSMNSSWCWRATPPSPSPTVRSIEIGPGSIVRLREGEQTQWEIRSRLRKVYLA
ncbi:MAG: hypothetical protein V9G13_13190 [Marmoricola sp.]